MGFGPGSASLLTTRNDTLQDVGMRNHHTNYEAAIADAREQADRHRRIMHVIEIESTGGFGGDFYVARSFTPGPTTFLHASFLGGQVIGCG